MKKVISKTLIAGAISTAMLAGAAQAAVTLVSWGAGCPVPDRHNTEHPIVDRRVDDDWSRC